MGGAWRNPAYAPLPLDSTIFGKQKSGYYGIPLLMDILDEHGFRATFFTEVFCGYNVGHQEVEKVFRCIIDRGHDAQLHLHPVQRFYRDFVNGMPRRERDLMFELPPEEQRALIAEGVDLFRRFTGKQPRAYRAGCYGASEVTLTALRENGIEIDSSYNLASLDASCGFATRPLNAPVVIDGVYEFPVTVFRVMGVSGYKPMEVSAVAVNEIIESIRSMRQSGCRDVVLSLHSFSLMKNLGLRHEQSKPDRIVIQRLRNLCAALSKMKSEVEVGVFGELDLSTVVLPQPQVVPTLGWLKPAVRKLTQAANRLSWL